MIALCGQGPGCEAALEHLLMLGTKVQIYTHAGPQGERLLAQGARWGVPGTTASINDPAARAYAFAPSLLVSVGYLEIVTAETLAASPGINCHYALLPRHRGRSSVPWAIIDGDRVSGVSWHWMTPEVDRGKLLLQVTCEIDARETQATLFDKLHELAGETFPAARRLAVGGWEGVAQRGSGSYHYAGAPHGGMINPMWDDSKIERFIRAMTYPPRPYATLAGREVKSMKEFYEAANVEGDNVYFL